MLDIMRRKKRLKAILWLVIISLGLGMLLFFVPGTDMGGVVTNSDAATVDDYSISLNDFASTYRRTVEQLRKRGNERMDPETLKAMGVPRQVLDDLITSKILEIIADRFGVEVTPNQVRKAIEVLPYFQNQGKFIGIESYKALLAENGYTAAAFEEEMHRVQLMNKLRDIITDSLEVSDREVRDEFSKLNQKTQVDYVILKQEDYKKRLKPTEAELRAYFDSHKEAYRTKEKRRAQYLQLPATQFLPSVKVTEEDILREWSQRSHEETTEAAHILFKVAEQAKDAEIKAKAEAVLKRIKSGEDFAALAKKHSEDTGSAVNGGYLGPFQRGQMVKEFENAAFSLKPGEISDLIRTQYGYHIIKTLKRETPTLDSNRGNLTMSIQIQKIQKLAKQKAEEAAALTQQSKNWELLRKSKKPSFSQRMTTQRNSAFPNPCRMRFLD
jgi:peptidyl-prolyl cis-trans isomerase D